MICVGFACNMVGSLPQSSCVSLVPLIAVAQRKSFVCCPGSDPLVILLLYAEAVCGVGDLLTRCA